MAEDNQFVADMLRGIQSAISELRAAFVNVERRIDKVEERMANLERRQSASAHFEQSVLAHLTSIHESVDSFRGDLVGVDRRLTVLEAR